MVTKSWVQKVMSEEVVSIGVKITKSMRDEMMDIIKKEGYYNISSFVREALRTHIYGWKVTYEEKKSY